MLAIVPLGSEFRVNTNTAGSQDSAEVAMDDGGNYVVTWQSYDGGILAQRFDATGTTIGDEFAVNTSVPAGQTNPDIAIRGDGSFLITWQTPQTGSLSIMARRFDAAGTPRGDEFPISPASITDQTEPSAAMDDAGNFVVSWLSGAVGPLTRDIVARRFNAVGVALGGPIPVAAAQGVFGPALGIDAQVAIDTDGDFVVAWSNDPGDGAQNIYARRFDRIGVAQGDEFLVNVFTDGTQAFPSVSMSEDGGFAVGWSGEGPASGASDVFARRFAADGNPLGGPFVVNSLTAGVQTTPEITLDAAGNLVAAWVGEAQSGDTDSGIYARQFDASNTPLGDEAHVNTFTSGDQFDPAVAVGRTGQFVVTWTDAAQDGDLAGVYGQRMKNTVTGNVAGGDPFKVNTFTTANQANPTIATQSNGAFVVAWESAGQDTSGYGIYAQRYNAAGGKIGAEFRVNSYTTGAQRNPSIAVDDLGNFVVAWQSVAQASPGDTDNYGVYARRYTVSGETVTPGNEFLVNTSITGIQRDPAVAMDSDGDFVIVWRSPDGANDGIFARRYDNTGQPLASQFAVNTVTANNQLGPAVDMDIDGDFVVTWQSYNQAGAATGFDIFARRNTAGNWEAAESVVNTVTAGLQEAPSIAMNPSGAYVISWASNLQDGNLRGIFARRFSSAGAALADPFQVNVYTTNEQRHSTAAIASDGRFVITWASSLQDGSSYGVYARRYDAAGVPADETVNAVNTHVTGSQSFPVVAMDSDGEFVVAWHSGDNEDGNGYGIFARRYGAGANAPQVTSGQFVWQYFRQRMEFFFDQDVLISLDDSDLILQNLTTSTTVDSSLILREWVPSGNFLRCTFDFPNGALPNGHYRATIVAAGIDAGGPAMAQDFVLNFFFVNGDADHNGNIDVNDLGILATNWQSPSEGIYALGDFDYSGTVEVNDLGILATSWQYSLGPAPAPALSARKTTTRAPAAVPNQAVSIVESTGRAPQRRA